MKKPHFDFGEATGRYLIPKLETIVKENPDVSGLVELPIKAMILGGYALEGICRKYGTKISRKTSDIDLYATDAKILGENVGPTGARIGLTEGFHAELFDWISGMDHEQDLQQRIDMGLAHEKFDTVYSSGNVKLYLPSPEIFVANKLFAYRGNTSRKKDLKDVKTVTNVLGKNKDSRALAKIEMLVKKYGLEPEYALATKKRSGK